MKMELNSQTKRYISMSKIKFEKGGNHAPLELYAALLKAGLDAVAKGSDEEDEHLNALWDLVGIAEKLPLPDGYENIPMMDFVAYATGLSGFESDNAIYEGEIIAHVQQEVLQNSSAQEFLNDYLCEHFGRSFDFTQLDNNLVQITDCGKKNHI
ncbi:MAG: hypothetical protein AAFV98_11690 [Chloroflexota bacterium]